MPHPQVRSRILQDAKRELLANDLRLASVDRPNPIYLSTPVFINSLPQFNQYFCFVFFVSVKIRF
jgi:hypothetical protein